MNVANDEVYLILYKYKPGSLKRRKHNQENKG